MADFKDHSSDDKTYRLGWDVGNAPPAYGPPAGPPPPGQPSSRAYANIPHAGYNDEGQAFRGNEYSSPSNAPSAPYAPSTSTAAYAPAQAAARYAPSASYSSRVDLYDDPAFAPQPVYGVGGLTRGLLGLPPRRTLVRSRIAVAGPPVVVGRRVGLVGAIVSAVDRPRDVTVNPSTPSFARTPQPQFPYSPFPPLVAVSLDRSLNRGFPMMPPTSQLQPHPFMAHDVNEDDWLQFLSDVQAGASRPVAALRPRAGLVGTLVGMGIESALEGDGSTSVAQVVEQWNAYFFHPRLMEVNLVHNGRIYTNSSRLSQGIVQQATSRSADNMWMLIITFRPM